MLSNFGRSYLSHLSVKRLRGKLCLNWCSRNYFVMSISGVSVVIGWAL